MSGELRYAVVWKTGIHSRRILCTHLDPAVDMSRRTPGSSVVELEEPIPYSEMTVNRGVKRDRYPEKVYR